MEKLKPLDDEFRGLYYNVISLIEEGSEDSDAEQIVFDKHDDDVAALTVCLCDTAPTSVTDAASLLKTLTPTGWSEKD